MFKTNIKYAHKFIHFLVPINQIVPQTYCFDSLNRSLIWTNQHSRAKGLRSL